ncbi:MFS general substrate transporter [Aspergillus ellipticus CBS 707.79]|uniref:MFS general substrate transporter n=1 Tax=Aspergillus ellipticus CBS 707.79 TaxID=1448320 RepID=A0A319DRX9_9EURO|nr:MFS general substrate transporter [Aspergillus ellipticus CBS 707.79]
MLDRTRSFLKANRSALLYCGVSTTGALVYGYDNTYYNRVLARQQFKNDYGTERDASGNLALASSFQFVTVSSVYIGDLLGAMLAAIINDRWGRKATFWVASLCILVGGIAQVADTHYEAVVIVGRILIGLGVGQFTVTSLLYIGEIAPIKIRGPALIQGTEKLNSSPAYKFPMGGLVVLPLFMFAALPFIPESPLWFTAKGRLSEAESVLCRLNRSNPDHDPIPDLATLKDIQQVNEANTTASTWGALLFDPAERTKTIYDRHQGSLPGTTNPNIIQIVSVTASMVTSNRVSRRTNLLVTTSIMLHAFIIIGGIGTQRNLSPGSHKIMSVSIVTFYLTAWVITFTAPYLYYDAGLGPMAGFVYAGTTVTSLVWIWFCVGETTGRSNWEIAKLFDMRIPARLWRYTTFPGPGEDDDDNGKEPVSVRHVDVVSQGGLSV